MMLAFRGVGKITGASESWKEHVPDRLEQIKNIVAMDEPGRRMPNTFQPT
jgi:hypothetical protein